MHKNHYNYRIIETSGSTARKPEHPNSDEVEENNTKKSPYGDTEALKEEMKKKIPYKNGRKEEINNSHEANQKKQSNR